MSGRLLGVLEIEQELGYVSPTCQNPHRAIDADVRSDRVRKSIFGIRWRQVRKVPADEAALVIIAPDLAMVEGTSQRAPTSHQRYPSP
jgi:hypothetical protein